MELKSTDIGNTTPLIYSTKHTFSLQLNGTSTYSFDHEGRPILLLKNGRCYVRSLDGQIKEKSWKQSRDIFDRYIIELNESESLNLYKDLYQDIKSIKDMIMAGHSYELRLSNEKEENSQKTVIKILDQLLHWSPMRLMWEEKEFKKVYKPVNILPPDQYYPVLLQIVEGCPWNKCSFCNFYEGREFRVRSIPEIIDHMNKIKSFLGKSLNLRRSIFLGDANALVMESTALYSIIKVIQSYFPDQTSLEGGIYCFGDIPAILGKKSGDLEMLRRAGLRRVYIGMESGSNEVRRLIRKPGKKKDLVKAVQALKEAQLEVGVILLLGIGSHPYEQTHVQDSVDALKNMNLGAGDIIYFSPYYPSEDSTYFNGTEEIRIPPMEKEAIKNQYKDFLKQLNFSKKSSDPLTAVYDIREFVY